MGEHNEAESENYSDFISLKRHLEWKHGNNAINVIRRSISQSGTASEVMLENKAVATISDALSTEETLYLKAVGNDAGVIENEGINVTIRYLNNKGESKSETLKITDDSNTNPIDFLLDDFYCWDLMVNNGNPLTSDAIVTCEIGIYDSNDIQVGVIENTKQTGKKTGYYGVGSVYGRLVSNHTDGHGFIATMDYYTPWFEVKRSRCTLLNKTDDEVIFLDSDGNNVGDFFRLRNCKSNKNTTTNTGAFIITDDDCGNVNGSGVDIYGGIVAGTNEYVSSRFFCATNKITYISKIIINTNSLTSGAIYLYLTKSSETSQNKIEIPLVGGMTVFDNIIHQLKEGSEFKLGIEGNGSDFAVSFWIFEVNK